MLDIGQSVGPYVILRKLGAGAMGVVFEAEQGVGGRRVAAKVLHRELSKSGEVLHRFFNEARALGQIGNPHVVQVTDFGQTEDGEYYLIMESLVGESLGEVLLRERRLDGRALDLAVQIADGLGAAHATGVVHRDLKPDNIFLIRRAAAGPPGELVKILDFGLAKLVFDAAKGPTREGMVLGTAEYMSPEQAESKKDIDHRSDIYALGILLYQMTTGLLPFVGASMGDVLVKHVSRSPAPPRQVNREVPEELEAIILRCLAKDPEDRFPGMVELRTALLACAGRTQPAPAAEPSASTTLPAMPARRGPHRSWWLLAGALVALAAVLVFARRPAAEELPPPLAPPTVRVLLSTTPAGAEVIDERTGASLGHTPVELRLPRGEGAQPLLFRHACCAEKRRPAPTDRDTEVSIDLQ